jgi:hypothetical protein
MNSRIGASASVRAVVTHACGPVVLLFCRVTVAFLLFSVHAAKSITIIPHADGFCHVDNTTGVHWLRCPSQNGGQKMLTIGANHVSNNCVGPGVGSDPGDPGGELLCATQECTCMTWDSNIKKSAYRLTTLALYGSDEGWANNTATRLFSWGFNTAGAWSSTVMESQGMLFTVVLDMGVDWVETTEHMFPDVFDPAWVANVSTIAALQCKPRASNPNLLGYFPDNELDWSGTIIDRFLKLAPTTPGGAEALRFLQQRYNNDITKLTKAWNVKECSSWSDLPNHAPFSMTAERSADCAAFLTIVADQYHSVTTSAIRTADPNHLVLGYRYYGIQKAVLLSAAKHVDVIDYHAYSENAPISELIEIHELTQLPVMVSEFGYRASDSGMLNTVGAGPVYATQTERTAGYERFATQLLKLPFLIGFHMFAWVDEPAAGNGWHENSNYGLVHLDDEPYAMLTGMFTQLNANASNIHSVPWTPPGPSGPVGPSPPPTLGFCAAGSEEECQAAVKGQARLRCSAGYEHVELHITNASVEVTALHLDAAGCLLGGTQACKDPSFVSAELRGVIYSDGGKEGGPKKLLGSTATVKLKPDTPRSFVELAFAEPVHLPAGKYWLGNQIGPDPVACFGFAAGPGGRAGCVYGQCMDTFAAGAPKLFPFGAVRSVSSLSIYASVLAR